MLVCMCLCVCVWLSVIELIFITEKTVVWQIVWRTSYLGGVFGPTGWWNFSRRAGAFDGRWTRRFAARLGNINRVAKHVVEAYIWSFVIASTFRRSTCVYADVKRNRGMFWCLMLGKQIVLMELPVLVERLSGFFKEF